MNERQPPKVRAPKGWIVGGGTVTLLGAVMALLYAVVQVGPPETGLRDGPLIVLITLNTLIVYRLGCSLSKDLGQLFFYFPEAGRDPQASVRHLLGDPILILPGVVFASFVGFTVLQDSNWDAAGQDPALRGWLAAFLFCNNLIIGAVLFALLRFWQMLLKELPKIEISVLNLASPVLRALLLVNSRIVMGTALVGSLAVCSIPLSDLTMNPVTKLFSGFAFAVVFATYAIPILPLSNLLSAKKAEALHLLEQRIETHVRLRCGLAPLKGMSATEKELGKLSDLIEARDIVARVRTLPPGGQFSVSAAAVVTFLSFLPSILDFALNRISLFTGAQ